MDQKLHRADGAIIPNVRLVLQCDDGALIYMTYSGIRHGPGTGSPWDGVRSFIATFYWNYPKNGPKSRIFPK